MMNVVSVVVTYNRLSLLKECVEALKRQTVPVCKIIIVDNHSTDGTAEYLQGVAADERFQIITFPENMGGSAGFSEGIRQAAYAHADWIWVMDDDTIPNEDALERLLPYTQIDKVGFVNSKVTWTDGTLHLMNKPTLLKDQSIKATLFQGRESLGEQADMIEMASFVSLLVRGNIPWEIGLPYKEFFIWCDDVEYTNRISSQGYYGIWAHDSVVLHKTLVNYEGNLKTISATAAWKLYYGVRNESFIRRKRKGWLRFFFAQLNCFRTHRRRIRSRKLPKEEEQALLKANNRGLWDGFTFCPKIDYLEQ